MSNRLNAANEFAKFENGTIRCGAQLLMQSGVFEERSERDTQELHILDNACGTGALTTVVKEQERLRDVRITATDIDESMIQYLEKRIVENDWRNVRVKDSNAMDLEFPDNHFSHALTNFCVMILTDPLKGILEMIRVTKPGGVIGFTTFHKLGWYPIAKRAVDLLPGPPPLDPSTNWTKTGLWHSPEYVENLLKSVPCSLEDVKVELFPFMMRMDGSRAYAYSPTVTNNITREWSEDQKRNLTETLRANLEKIVEEMYGKDTPFDMEFVAVIATGIKPI